MERKSGFIAIAGRPNAGKSTLLNQVLGAKVSIVTPKAQTTRERVLGILTEARGQIVFIDTPGIHRAKEGGINSAMMEEVREALQDVAVIWYLVDPDSGMKHEEAVLETLKQSKAPVMLIVNKVDLKGKDRDFKAIGEEVKQGALAKGIQVAGVFLLSARYGQGVEDLLHASWQKMPVGPLYYPDEEQLSDRPTRYFVAEKVREQLYLQLGDELPYSCAVEIENFDEQKRPPRIEAVIHVERDSQKGMVIGKGGQKIKEIGQAARKQVEDFLGQSVFLGLRVHVLKDWTRNADTLKRLGYNLPKTSKAK